MRENLLNFEFGEMDSNQNQHQELIRSHSLPVLNREEAVIKKVQEQDGIISLMQTQIEFQSEVIAKHDKAIENLLSKIDELTSKVKTLEDNLSQQSDSADQNAAKSALWSSSTTKASGENQISIAELVKETAEQTLGTESAEPGSGYVYDENLGLYFDQSSGYYYDPVKQLFYNGHTKTYYSYDSSNNTYQEVRVATTEGTKRKKNRKSNNKKSSMKHQKVTKPDSPDSARNDSPKSECISKDKMVNNDEQINDNSGSRSPQRKSLSDMEEGEISSSLPTSAESSPRSVQTCGSDSDSEDQAKYPPCIRAVVQSGPSGLKKGTLFLVPFTGGTIGSSESSSIYLPFSFIEEVHAKIEYQAVQPESLEEFTDTTESTDLEKFGKYLITDLGSREGTYINRSRLSLPGVPSEPHELVHGSTVMIGEITLLIHIHPGDFTCGHCEPGLLLQKDPMYEYTGKTTENIRKEELKKVKKKFGLDRKRINIQLNSMEANYKDRAKDRRLVIGSDNPFAKTEVASTEKPIDDKNKGFKMLQKMGWKGESLGSKDSEGIKEPINCDLKADRGGLGFHGPSTPLPAASSNKTSLKSQKLAKTIERFNEANMGPESPKDVKDLDY